MEIREAIPLVRPDKEVVIKRLGGRWRGAVVAVITEPCLILRQPGVGDVAIVLDEAEVEDA